MLEGDRQLYPVISEVHPRSFVKVVACISRVQTALLRPLAALLDQISSHKRGTKSAVSGPES